MKSSIQYFQTILHNAFSLYFKQETPYVSLQEIPSPDQDEIYSIVGRELSWEEKVVLLLGLMPHISPESLDLFFIQNKNIEKPFTEFGGWKGTSHSGFLPTGETAAFLLTLNNPNRQNVTAIFAKDHWFYKNNVLRLQGQGEGEPFLSGRLCISDEILDRIYNEVAYHPDYNYEFPAKRIETRLNWEDLVIDESLRDDIYDISKWIRNEQEIRSQLNFDWFLKPGYRVLLQGPPGTGKTLTACLMGKIYGRDVYRVDLSMIVSKYIGETEKNLAKIFDRAQNQNWILFFDEADTLFCKRTNQNNSNDRHANHEIAYLLQRIEDFPGLILFATNLKENIDRAFLRRFQAVLNFSMPNEQLRMRLWQQMIPKEWLGGHEPDLLPEASRVELSGGNIANIIQYCALVLYSTDDKILTAKILNKGINRELMKEGRL